MYMYTVHCLLRRTVVVVVLLVVVLVVSLLQRDSKQSDWLVSRKKEKAYAR